MKKPLIYALGRIRKEELKKLVNRKDIEGIRRLIKDSKALDEAKRKAFEHADKKAHV